MCDLPESLREAAAARICGDPDCDRPEHMTQAAKLLEQANTLLSQAGGSHLTVKSQLAWEKQRGIWRINFYRWQKSVRPPDRPERA